MGSLTNRTEVIPGPKCSLTASSSVSKVKFPTKAVKGGTVGTGSSSRGGPEKPESTNLSVKFLVNTWSDILVFRDARSGMESRYPDPRDGCAPGSFLAADHQLKYHHNKVNARALGKATSSSAHDPPATYQLGLDMDKKTYKESRRRNRQERASVASSWVLDVSWCTKSRAAI
jgi:hypothetical protein